MGWLRNTPTVLQAGGICYPPDKIVLLFLRYFEKIASSYFLPQEVGL